jgi:hypothetical protein
MTSRCGERSLILVERMHDCAAKLGDMGEEALYGGALELFHHNTGHSSGHTSCSLKVTSQSRRLAHLPQTSIADEEGQGQAESTVGALHLRRTGDAFPLRISASSTLLLNSAS